MSKEKLSNQCRKIEDCGKVGAILDKDLLEVQYSLAIRELCSSCNEFEPRTKKTAEDIKRLREISADLKKLGVPEKNMKMIDAWIEEEEDYSWR